MEEDMSRYIVKTAAAQMPQSCWGTYRRVAVMEVVGPEPRMISENAKGVIRIVKTWEKRNVGKTKKSAYERALAEAHELVKQLNNARKNLRRNLRGSANG
jgi:hypothetical protein